MCRICPEDIRSGNAHPSDNLQKISAVGFNLVIHVFLKQKMSGGIHAVCLAKCGQLIGICRLELCRNQAIVLHPHPSFTDIVTGKERGNVQLLAVQGLEITVKSGGPDDIIRLAPVSELRFICEERLHVSEIVAKLRFVFFVGQLNETRNGIFVQQIDIAQFCKVGTVLLAFICVAQYVYIQCPRPLCGGADRGLPLAIQRVHTVLVRQDCRVKGNIKRIFNRIACLCAIAFFDAVLNSGRLVIIVSVKHHTECASAWPLVLVIDPCGHAVCSCIRIGILQ